MYWHATLRIKSGIWVGQKYWWQQSIGQFSVQRKKIGDMQRWFMFAEELCPENEEYDSWWRNEGLDIDLLRERKSHIKLELLFENDVYCVSGRDSWHVLFYLLTDE